MDRLTALGAQLPSHRFVQLAERALFAADVIGYVHSDEEAGK
jgi:hypothetical protein